MGDGIRRWLGTARGALDRMDRMNLGLIAAGCAFFAMLSVFPALAAVIALFGFFADPGVIDTQMAILAEFLPDQAFALLNGQVRALIAANSSTLGWTTVLSLGFALWSARAGVSALTRGLNAIHRAPHRQGLHRVVSAYGLTLALVALALVALAAVVVVPLVLAFAPLGAIAVEALGWAQWALALFTVVSGIWLVYRLGPNVDRDRHSRIAPGLIVAVVLWVAVSLAFSAYLQNFGNYNRVYGSIGAVIALLMWFYISAYVVLLGAAVNAELARFRRLRA
ncbi:MAG: YihY/virulence factor BrkB family protein [Paracoccaceae bacterium]